mmetsp:Transcript_24694/g.40407  ORF Transcript_24694/g.40407 Transcript_24694/m.40407 type:complete len:109 (-) Transcript_24694:1116-1442(-)
MIMYPSSLLLVFASVATVVYIPTRIRVKVKLNSTIYQNTTMQEPFLPLMPIEQTNYTCQPTYSFSTSMATTYGGFWAASTQASMAFEKAASSIFFKVELLGRNGERSP